MSTTCRIRLHRTCVFRIVQEAVRNAKERAKKGGIRARIRCVFTSSKAASEHACSVSVQDDGKGFDPAQDAGLGLLGMQERVMSLAVKLEVNSKPGSGAIVTFSLPLPHQHIGLWTIWNQGRVSGNQAFSYRIKNQLRQIVQIEFLENVVAVCLHR